MIKLKKFYDLSYEEKLLILDWRNDISVRKWMYTSEIIEKDNHLNFIERLKDVKNTKYFLVFKSEKPIGVIYFTNIKYDSNVCEFGLYKNPNIKGVGDVLLNEIIDYVFGELKLQKLVAEVFSENIKAIQLYKTKGFKEYKRKIVNDKEIICMELKNENR